MYWPTMADDLVTIVTGTLDGNDNWWSKLKYLLQIIYTSFIECPNGHDYFVSDVS